MSSKLSSNPFVVLYAKPALLLVLQEIDSLQPVGVSAVVAWVKSAPPLPAEALRAPTGSPSLFEAHLSSLLRLASAVSEPARFSKSLDDAELEENAALLLSFYLLRRAAQQEPSGVAASTEAKEVAARRSWGSLNDALDSLSLYSNRLLTLGAPVLLDHPTLLSHWEQGPSGGAFTDMVEMLQRRLDLVTKYEALFDGSVVNKSLLEEGFLLQKDAGLFFRGREGRGAIKSELIETRDIAFSLLLLRMERLQRFLYAAYLDDPVAQRKIRGDLWKLLGRLSRPRKSRKQATETK